jgi:hypothetical protein
MTGAAVLIAAEQHRDEHAGEHHDMLEHEVRPLVERRPRGTMGLGDRAQLYRRQEVEPRAAAELASSFSRFAELGDLSRRGLGEAEEESPEPVGHEPQRVDTAPVPIGRMRVF